MSKTVSNNDSHGFSDSNSNDGETNDKHNDIMGYRNKSYKSLMTGNTAPAHHTPWLDELDDSYDSYMKN